MEVGCGTGRNLIAIARIYPHTRLYGLDASDVMLQTARQRVRNAGLKHRMVLRQGLAEELSARTFGLETFDHVLFSYCLSMVPDWRAGLGGRPRHAVRPGAAACGGLRGLEGAGLYR